VSVHSPVSLILSRYVSVQKTEHKKYGAHGLHPDAVNDYFLEVVLLKRNAKWDKISHYGYGIMKLCEDNHGAYPHRANYYLLRKFWVYVLPRSKYKFQRSV